MIRPVVVVKIGGAAVTDKSSSEPLLRDISPVVGLVRQAHDKVSLVLVLGAGSFGHGLAKQSGFSSSHSVAADQASIMNAVRVRQQVMQLAALVTAALVEAGVPIMSLSLPSYDAIEPASLMSLIHAGCVPLLHGDMVLDDLGGLRVCSGDTIAARLAQLLSAERLVFVSSHALHSRNPDEFPDAELVREVRRGECVLAAVGCENNDVSGAMRGKLGQAFDVEGVAVVIAPVAHALEAIIGPLPGLHFTTIWPQ